MVLLRRRGGRGELRGCAAPRAAGGRATGAAAALTCGTKWKTSVRPPASGAASSLGASSLQDTDLRRMFFALIRRFWSFLVGESVAGAAGCLRSACSDFNVGGRAGG